jgi:hypothetical protein
MDGVLHLWDGMEWLFEREREREAFLLDWGGIFAIARLKVKEDERP